MNVHFQRISLNSKTGPIPVTMTERKSCPISCPLRKACYANFGYMSMNWNALSYPDHKHKNLHNVFTDWSEFCNQIRALPKGQIWRHNAAGDLPGEGDTIDHAMLAELVDANRNRRGYAYSHKPVGLSGQALINACAIYAANKNGFTISLSAEGLADADRLAGLKIAPVVAVVPRDAPQVMRTPGGLHAIMCPHDKDETFTCDRCQLCAKSWRKAIVCFRAHGRGFKHAEKIIKEKNYLPVIQGTTCH